MAVYKIFPIQDTTLYSDYTTLNTGLDSILDLSKTISLITPSSSAARILIQFSNDDIQNTVNNIINPSITSGSWVSNLKLYNANVQGIPTNFSIEIHPIYESWDMGTGRFSNNPENSDGATWQYRNANSTNAWQVNSFINPAVTASYVTSNAGGGNWYTSSVSQSFSYYTNKDINTDVTQFTAWFYSGSINNNGFIIKNTGSIEFDKNYQYIFDFFSRDTNTIYPPCLEFKWKDSTFNTGSTAFIGTENLLISVSNNKNIFYNNEVVKFRIFAKEKYPPRVFSTTSLYIYNKLLPVSSSYSIIDMDTNNKVIDFDWNYTQLSADTTSSYFNLYMNGLEPERYYKIQIKSKINSGTYTYDDGYYFKVSQTV
jgi:hypothetical protein